jgi:magnesium transporter
MISAYLMKKGEPFRPDITRAEMLAALREKGATMWIDLEAPTEFESDSLVEIFNFHPLAIEDCLSDHSQPKVDDYEEYLFMVFHSAVMAKVNGGEELSSVELAVFLGKNYVVTFHKTPVRTIEQMREAVKKKPDYILGQGADILFHNILDRLVDNYQPIMDLYDEKVDKLEEDMFEKTSADFLPAIIQTKRDIFNFRRFVAPQRDVVNFLTRTPTAFIHPKHMIYFRDIYDHLVRIQSLAEGFHESMASLLQAHFSYSSARLNEVVKHMTVMATLTMPAVIVSSIYGMNFEFMPELGWKLGYPFSFGVMIFISVAMLIWMKVKKWI